MLNSLDQQLLEALSFGRFDNAEALIQKGADINALTSAHELDDPSVLADAIFEEGFRPDLIVDFALTHGLDPSAHNGLHILKALAYLCDCDVNLCTLRAFHALLDTGIDFSKDFKIFDEETLVAYCDDQLASWLYNDNATHASICAIFRDIVKARLAKQCGDDYTLIDQAVGHTIHRILLWQQAENPTPLDARENHISFKNHFAQWLVLDLGEQVLVVLEGTHAYLMSKERLHDAPLLDMSNHFPSLIGQRIDKAFFNISATTAFRTVLHLSTKEQFVVGWETPSRMTVDVSEINIHPTPVMQKIDKTLAQSLALGEFNDALRLIEAGANINAIAQWDEQDDSIDPSTAIVSILSEATQTKSNLETLIDFMSAHGLDPMAHKGRHILAGLASLIRTQKPDEHTLRTLKKLLALPVNWAQPIRFEDSAFLSVAEHFEIEVTNELSTQQDQKRAAYFALFATIVRAHLVGRELHDYQTIDRASGLTVRRVLLTSESTLLQQRPNLVTFNDFGVHKVILDLGKLALVIPDHRYAFIMPMEHLRDLSFLDVSDSFKEAIGKTISSIVFGTDTDKKGPFGTLCLLRDRGVLAVSELKNQFSLTFTS